MKRNIVYVADIADDIDDVVAIEYLANSGYLKCVVLDGESRDYNRERDLEKIGVLFKTEIPKDSKVIFCGGALTKISEFTKLNKIELLVVNGGYAGVNIIKKENALRKFKNKEKVRTYNFNINTDAALAVLFSKNINEIILVSKNVCHSELNCFGKIHLDSFLNKYNLDKRKRLHDLLMVKEGLNYILGDDMKCEYSNIVPIYEINEPKNMSIWGSKLSENSNICISTALKSK